MAPPASRRSGYSRRALYGLFFGYVVAIGGVLLALLLLIVAIVDPRGFSAVRGAALDVTMPVSAGGRAVTSLFGGGGEAIAAWWRAGSQNAELKRRLQVAETRIVAAQAAELENRKLRALLGLARQSEDRVAIGRIVGSSFDTSRHYATLSAGSGDGVRVGQPVRAAEGLIGRVVATGHTAARVLMISDGASTIPVQLLPSGTPALAAGRGDGTLELRPLEIGQNPFKPGAIVVTSGVGGVYPPGIPVARVVTATKDTTIARPLANPARFGFAIVQRIYMPEAAAPPEAALPAPAAAPPGPAG